MPGTSHRVGLIVNILVLRAVALSVIFCAGCSLSLSLGGDTGEPSVKVLDNAELTLEQVYSTGKRNRQGTLRVYRFGLYDLRIEAWPSTPPDLNGFPRIRMIHDASVTEVYTLADRLILDVKYRRGYGTGAVMHHRKLIEVKSNTLRVILEQPHSGYVMGWTDPSERAFETRLHWNPIAPLDELEIELLMFLNGNPQEPRRFRYVWDTKDRRYNPADTDDTLDDTLDRFLRGLDKVKTD